MYSLLNDRDRLQNHIHRVLNTNLPVINNDETELAASSSVLFLIGDHPIHKEDCRRPHLILTKRSRWVSQPGDLCFPGGRAAPRFDAAFAKLLALPGFPFKSWQKRNENNTFQNNRRLAQFLATSLRESFEEMRLIPLGIRFLGPLPPHRLVLFHRTIYPMVGWVHSQKSFKVNGEVDRVIQIPIEKLLDSDQYAYFEMSYPSNLPTSVDTTRREFACFVHQNNGDTDILWGATYRMVTAFLSQVFEFQPPGPSKVPLVENPLPADYFTRR